MGEDVKFMLPGEASKPLKVTPAGVKNLIARGLLRCVRTQSGVHLVYATDVAELAEAREAQKVGRK